ncbi:MAG: threonine synthase [Kiritimatiellia bacterium]|jgi:threonine synthase|nr:threonine synthase [Kiritimatiellia bacterium]MDP6631767.1 threonine synthase [Kiritimatiellia bacterium]MDP6810479.1 threonine synthase [Kiritimatiellia bacterium]MDP7025003.1 threonine synthase [Kiritimatiellia bacterium]
MTYMTGYRCTRCDAEYGVDEDSFICPTCSGNLSLLYDYGRLRELAGSGGLFGRPGDGILRFRPLLPLGAQCDLHLHVGDTPLQMAARLGERIGVPRLYLKNDTVNPSASFKDRAGAVALLRARKMGADVIACASTGNAGSSMACLAASEDVSCVVFVPASAPEPKLTQLLSFGAKVLAVDGSYDQAYDLCAAACRRKGWFNRNTGSNPFTREGKKTCSYEIWEQLGERVPDWIVVPTGDGNIISGIWKGMLELREIGLSERLPKLLCAQSESSAAVGRTVRAVQESGSPGETLDWTRIEVENVEASTVADSICVNRPRDGLAAVRAVIESGGAAVAVPDERILSAVGELAAGTGVFAEPAAAASWACLKKAVADKVVGRDEEVVCLVTGSGLKDVGAVQDSVGKPIHIAPTLEAVEEVLG